MASDIPDPATLIPPIGSIPQADRMFLVTWVGALERTATGSPLHTPHYAAKQGGRVRLVDIREERELTGPLGHIPGCDWVPESRAESLGLRLDADEAVILISHDGQRAAEVARGLERGGLRFVAGMAGGVVAWKDLGYSTSRDREILERRDVLHRAVARPLGAGEELTRDHVDQHLGDKTSVRWIKVAALLLHGRLSCVDGRDDAGVLGTPGGDAGELVLALSALEKVTGHTLSPAQIDSLLRARLDMLGRFYMHTDVTASNHAIAQMRADRRFDEALTGVGEALTWRRFWECPPEGVRAPLLAYASEPANIGCGHLRRALQFSDAYGTRPEIVSTVLSAFHRERWAGSPEMDLVVLGGDHHEGAVLSVRVQGDVHPFTRIPLVSPTAFGQQMFVNHPQVASYLRRQLAEMIVLSCRIVGEVDAAALHAEMERLAEVQLASTLGALAKGLPIFEVTFDPEGRHTVSATGRVPS